MNPQDLNIQKRYWEDLIYRYKVWNQPEKQKEAQDAYEMVIREMDKRLEQVLSYQYILSLAYKPARDIFAYINYLL